MSTISYTTLSTSEPSAIPTRQSDVLDELQRTVIEIALLEARQDAVREQLQHCRARRRGLGREYVQLIRATAH